MMTRHACGLGPLDNAIELCDPLCSFWEILGMIFKFERCKISVFETL